MTSPTFDPIAVSNSFVRALVERGYDPGTVPIKSILLGDGSVLLTAASGALSIGNGDPAGNTSGNVSCALVNSTNVTPASKSVVTATGATWTMGSVTEVVTIAAAASTDSTISLPANSVIRAVTGKVKTIIPTAATFTVGDPTTAARFATGVAVAAGTQFVGILQADQTGAAGPIQATAAKVRITPDAQPATATGVVSITIFYDTFGAPAS